MRDGEGHGETRRTNGPGRSEKIKSEFMRGAKRKVPKKALVGAVVGLAACVVIIVAVIVAFGGFGRSATVGDYDVPVLATVEGDTLIVDDPIDAGQVAYLRISNYPELSFAPPGTALASDRGLIERACDLLSGARFVPWDGYAQYEEETSRSAGGYASSLALLGADQEAFLSISYDPGIASIGEGPGEGICIRLGEMCCVMESDQGAIVDFIDECVESASSEYRGDAEGAYREFNPADPHTWVPEDDIDKYEASQSQGTGDTSSTSDTSDTSSTNDTSDKEADHV